jgi:hypothetical protein
MTRTEVTPSLCPSNTCGHNPAAFDSDGPSSFLPIHVDTPQQLSIVMELLLFVIESKAAEVCTHVLEGLQTGMTPRP